ncbi:MAG: hypothetical protein D3923_11275 [Candidatus Electrothrix sp. AR3]|nr:hypothetical protein [Candidatus Electrothrix sp. AR3]
MRLHQLNIFSWVLIDFWLEQCGNKVGQVVVSHNFSKYYFRRQLNRLTLFIKHQIPDRDLPKNTLPGFDTCCRSRPPVPRANTGVRPYSARYNG